MKKEDLFSAIGEADESLLEKTEQKPRRHIVLWSSLAAVACFALVFTAATKLIKSDRLQEASPSYIFSPKEPTHQADTADVPQDDAPTHSLTDMSSADDDGAKELDLPTIRLTAVVSGSAGGDCSDVVAESLDAYFSNYPDFVTNAPDTLPVFENLAFHEGAEDIPFYFGEDEMMQHLQEAADQLGVTILSTTVSRIGENIFLRDASYNGTAVSVLADTDHNGRLSIDGNGVINMAFGNVNTVSEMTLPDEYDFRNAASAEENQRAMGYLLEQYSPFYQIVNPHIYSQTDVAITGVPHTMVYAYEESDDVTQAMLNCCFSYVFAGPDGDNHIGHLRKFSDLSHLQKLADYPLISVDEAKASLLDGKYETSFWNSNDADMSGYPIVRVDLLYRSEMLCSHYLPYYRFMLETKQLDNGCKGYMFCYVPAISQDFIVRMEPMTGHSGQ